MEGGQPACCWGFRLFLDTGLERVWTLSDHAVLAWLPCLVRSWAAHLLLTFQSPSGSGPLLCFPFSLNQTPWWVELGLGWCRWKCLPGCPTTMCLLCRAGLGPEYPLSCPASPLPASHISPENSWVLGPLPMPGTHLSSLLTPSFASFIPSGLFLDLQLLPLPP